MKVSNSIYIYAHYYFNANGIRSAERKDFFTWMQLQNTEIICIQETKAQLHQLIPDLFCPTNYHCFYHDAKKDHSGAALYCKKQPDKFISSIGRQDVDAEGRFYRGSIWQFKRYLALFIIRLTWRRQTSFQI
ncbi:MAG: endonuclease/exonuclease/phosphatase family protein [Methylobacter sp.]